MDSHWTDELNIDDDLCKAQEIIPVNIYNGLNTKSPEHYVFEEKLEYIGGCCDNTDFQSGPDLDIIHQMLHLVKDVNIHTNDSQDTENVIEISKVNSKCILANVNVASDNSKDKDKLFKKKKQRNVAIASLLEGISKESILINVEDNEIGFQNDQQMKLLKPDDFILKPESNQLLETSNKCGSSVKDLVTEDSALMFKKKTHETNTRNVNESPKTESKKSDAYQPSGMAELYYKKYLERSKFKERMQKSSEEFYKKIKSNEDFVGVQLPYHRHMLMQDCIVCNVICRKLFDEMK